MYIYCDLNCNTASVSWIFVLENESKWKSIPFCECVCLCQLHAKQKCSILQKLMEQTVFEHIMWRICYYFSTANNSRDDKFGLLLHYNCYPTPFLHFPIFVHFDTKYKYHRNVEWDTVIELQRTRLHIMLNRFHHHGMANPKVVNRTDSLHTGGGWRSCEYIKQAVTDRRQGVVLQHWGWAENNNSLPQKYSVEIL